MNFASGSCPKVLMFTSYKKTIEEDTVCGQRALPVGAITVFHKLERVFESVEHCEWAAISFWPYPFSNWVGDCTGAWSTKTIEPSTPSVYELDPFLDSHFKTLPHPLIGFPHLGFPLRIALHLLHWRLIAPISGEEEGFY